ncbi:unnamed protein product [Paramecium pentaurelia]|uniref:Uncharacterized protein n=1 Tax=Paramecium pentaurelia TaxID=43138 RepID=A0A8S1UJR5_9CILI|nr:unnamed protein product [Paramecium pentaurelia]
MKKNVASSSTPNSKKNSAKYFQQDQFQQQPQISQFISIEDQSQSDQLKNDESLISNDLTQACSTNLVLQENQDYRDNQMEFINNDDDVKINADLNILNSSDTEKFNQINHQIDNNLINEISQNESIGLQNQNPDQYQNLQQEKSHYFNLIENQDQIQQINKERHQYSNKKQITIQINDDEIANYKSEIEQGQQINSELSLNLLEDQTINLVQQQDIEGSLEDDQDQQLIHLEDNIENNFNMQTLKIVEKWEDITVVNCEEIKENTYQELIEEHCKTDKIEQLQQIVTGSSQQGEQINILGCEIKNDIQEVENKQQQSEIKIKYSENNFDGLIQDNNRRESNKKYEINQKLDQIDESNNEEISQEIVKAKTDEQCMNQDNNYQSKLDNESQSFERGTVVTGYCTIESKQFLAQIQMSLGQDKINQKQEFQMKIAGLNSILKESLLQYVLDQKQNNQSKDEQDNKCVNHQNSQLIDEQLNKYEDQKYSKNDDHLNSQHKEEQQNLDEDQQNSQNDHLNSQHKDEQQNQNEDQQNSQNGELNSQHKDEQQNLDEDQQNSQNGDKLNSQHKNEQQNQDEDQQNSQNDDHLNSQHKDEQQNLDEDQQNSQNGDKLNSQHKNEQQNQDEDQQNSQNDDHLNSQHKDEQQNLDEDQQNSQNGDKLNSQHKNEQQNQDEDQQNSQNDDHLNSQHKDEQQNLDEDQQNSQNGDKLNSQHKNEQQNQDEDQQNSQNDDHLNSQHKDEQQNLDEDQQNSQNGDKLNSQHKNEQQNQDEDQQNSQNDDHLNSQHKDEQQNLDEDQQNSQNGDKLNSQHQNEQQNQDEDQQNSQNDDHLNSQHKDEQQNLDEDQQNSQNGDKLNSQHQNEQQNQDEDQQNSQNDDHLNSQHKDEQQNLDEDQQNSQNGDKLNSQHQNEQQNQDEDQQNSQNDDHLNSQHKDEQQNLDEDQQNSQNGDKLNSQHQNEQQNQDEDQQNSQNDDHLNSQHKDEQQNLDEDQQNSQNGDKLNSQHQNEQQNQDEDQQNSQNDDHLNSQHKDEQQNLDEDQQNSQNGDKLNSQHQNEQQNQDEDQQNSQNDDHLNSQHKDEQQNLDEDQQNSQNGDKLNSQHQNEQQNQDEDQQNSQNDDHLNSQHKDEQQNLDEDQQNSQNGDKLNSQHQNEQQNQDEDQQNSQNDDHLNSQHKDEQQNLDEDQQNSQNGDKLNSQHQNEQQNQDEDQQNSQNDDHLNSQHKDEQQNLDEDQQNSQNDDYLNNQHQDEYTYFNEDIQLCPKPKPQTNLVQAKYTSSGLLLLKKEHVKQFQSVSFNDKTILHKQSQINIIQKDELILRENYNFNHFQEQSNDVEPNLSKVNELQSFDNLQFNSEQRNISNQTDLYQQDQESISEIQISQSFLHKFSLNTQNQEKEEQNSDQIINFNGNERIYDKIDDSQLDKQTRFINENQNIQYCNQKLNQFELFSLKTFDQESQEEVGKKNQENNNLLEQQIYIHKEVLGEICEQLQQTKIQDLGSENAQEFDLNNNDIQQQVNLEDIEVNKQGIFQEDVYSKLQQQKLENQNNQEQHQELTQCEEDQGFCNKEIIEVENNQKLEQNVVMLNLNCNDEEMEQIQQQANNVFQPQINNFSQQNEKMDQDINQTEDHQIYSNSQENEEGTLNKNQQDSEHTNDIINNQYESSQKKQSIKLIDHSEQHQDFQEEENLLKPQQHREKQGIEGQNRTFTSQKKISSQRENFFLSQTKIKNQEDSLNQNQFNSSLSQNLKEYNSSKSNDHYNFDLGHGELNRDNYLKENADDLQEQRKQKIRDLEQQIEWAEREIEEKDEEINQNKEMIENFENFVLGNTNPEEFEKIILSESNFETENLLINHLINKLRQFMQEFSNSIIDLINRFDGKTELEKDEEQEQEEQEKIKLITNEFKKFKQKKQQKKEIDDNKNQIIIHIGENNEKIVNDELNILISSIIGQTKLLRDILQKNCCLLIKFNCEVYNGLQGMSKNIKQLEQIKSLTNSVKQTTQHYQSIINEQVDLQQAKDDNNHILLLDLLKQLINKQEQAFQFQQLFTKYLSERIDLVHQSEENLREDMAKRLQTFN